MLEQTVQDEQLLAYVCALDEGDDPLVDPSCWPKTNPYIGVSVKQKYLERQVQNAKNMPSELNTVLRLNFCIWTQADSRAIKMDQWRACQPLPSEEELVGVECYGCLDLGETDDFTAWGRLWTLEDGRVAVKMRYWIPQIALERYPNRPYTQWERDKLLMVTEGDVTDYAFVRAQIVEDCRADGITSIFFDQSHARETAQLLMAEGIDMVPIGQGFALNEAIKRFLELIVSGRLCHGNELILSWMADHAVVLRGTKGDRRMAKERASEKIDGIVALVMGVEGALVRRDRVEHEPQVFFVGGRA